MINIRRRKCGNLSISLFYDRGGCQRGCKKLNRAEGDVTYTQDNLKGE